MSLTERARRALTELDRARAELAPPPDGVTGMVTVGLLESTVDLLAGRWCPPSCVTTRGSNYALLTAYSGHLQAGLTTVTLT